IYDGDSGQASGGHVISNNRFDNIYTPVAGRGVGLEYNAYANIVDNVMTRVHIGGQTGNFNLPKPSGAPAPSISDNTISGLVGIWHNLHYSAASTWTISGNSLSAGSASDTPGPSIGLEVTSMSTDVTIQDNDISGFHEGISLWNDP